MDQSASFNPYSKHKIQFKCLYVCSQLAYLNEYINNLAVIQHVDSAARWETTLFSLLATFVLIRTS